MLAEVEQCYRSRSVADDLAMIPGFGSTGGGEAERVERLLANVGGHTGGRADFGHQFGGGGCVMGQIVGGAMRGYPERRGDPGMALRASRFGERLIHRFTHRVAAETPMRRFHLQQTLEVEFVQGGPREVLVHRCRKPLEAHHAAAQPQHRRIVEYLPFGHRKLVEASRDDGAQRIGQLTGRAFFSHHRGEFLQEQRVPATALIERTDEALIGNGSFHIPLVELLVEQLHRELLTLGLAERFDGNDHLGGALIGRRPVQVGTRAHGGDEDERQTVGRHHQMFEQIEHRLVGPVQVVDPQHQGGRCGTQLDDAGEQALHRGALGRWLERVERRRHTYEVHQHIGDPLGVGRIVGFAHKGFSTMHHLGAHVGDG